MCSQLTSANFGQVVPYFILTKAQSGQSQSGSTMNQHRYVVDDHHDGDNDAQQMAGRRPLNPPVKVDLNPKDTDPHQDPDDRTSLSNHRLVFSCSTSIIRRASDSYG